MWEEDPRWQQATYRFLIGAVALGLAASFGVSLFSGYWGVFEGFLEALGGIAAVLCLYAAVVWTTALLARTIWMGFKKQRHKS